MRQTKKVKDLEHEIDHLDEQQKQLEDELEAETPQTGKIEALEQAIKNTESEMTIDENQYQESMNELRRLNEEQREVLAQLQAVDEEATAIGKAIARRDLNKRRLEKDQHERVLDKNEALGKVDDARRKRQNLDERKQGQEAKVEEFISEASKVSGRVAINTGETADSIDKKLVKLQQELTRARTE